MEQRVSLITLGVDDVARARRFYEALGWAGESPDGHPWETAHNPEWVLGEDGAVRLR